MRRTKCFAALFLGALALTSCFGRVKELYRSGEFLGKFSDLYFSKFDIPESKVWNTTSIELNKDQFFNGDHEQDFDPKTIPLRHGNSGLRLPEDDGVHKGPVSKGFSDIFDYEGKSLVGKYDWSITKIDNGDDAYIGQDFGRSKCLSTIDPSFKDAGYVSKLYNGQLQCLGLHALAFVSLDSKGYNTFFPKTLESSKYFMMSFRGGSDDDTLHGGEHSRICMLNLKLDFYYAVGNGYDLVSVSLPHVYANTDNSGEGVTFVGFSFEEINLDPKGIVGFGVSYADLVDPAFLGDTKISTTRDDGAKYHWSMLLYEVMFPDSRWVK